MWASAAVLLLAIAVGGYLYWRSHEAASATYQQLTIDPGYTGPARFTRDANTVIYSASRNGGPRQLYSHRSNGTQSTPLDLDADVMGIADNGDMALILKRRFLASWLNQFCRNRLILNKR